MPIAAAPIKSSLIAFKTIRERLDGGKYKNSRMLGDRKYTDKVIATATRNLPQNKIASTSVKQVNGAYQTVNPNLVTEAILFIAYLTNLDLTLNMIEG